MVYPQVNLVTTLWIVAPGIAQSIPWRRSLAGRHPAALVQVVLAHMRGNAVRYRAIRPTPANRAVAMALFAEWLAISAKIIRIAAAANVRLDDAQARDHRDPDLGPSAELPVKRAPLPWIVVAKCATTRSTS